MRLPHFLSSMFLWDRLFCQKRAEVSAIIRCPSLGELYPTDCFSACNCHWITMNRLHLAKYAIPHFNSVL